MHKKIIYALLGILFVVPVVGTIAGIKYFQIQALIASAANQTVPPEAVNSFDVKSQEWQPRVYAIGSVVAVQGTTLSAEAEGTVREIAFEAGSVVKAGDVLVKLDTDVEQAQLRAAEAQANWAQTSFKRAQELFASRTISQAEVDSADAAVKQANAQADNIRALIAKKTLRAPFDGRLGIRRISLGQFLNKGSPVVSLQSLDPVYVEFNLPQQRLGEIAEGLQVEVTTDSYPAVQFHGKITAVNPDVDPSTRNVRIQASLPNDDGRLRPGMFVSVNMVVARKEQVLFIPETAVLYAPYGDSVFVIHPGDDKDAANASLVVRQQVVRLGARHGDFIVVEEGLKPGDKIVSTAPFKLRPGMAVVIDNSLAPDAQLAPAPHNT